MRFSIVRRCFVALVFLAMVSPLRAEPRLHAISIHGAPKYPPAFTHFDYVNPDAPKGGAVKIGRIGTFDSFNPYIIKGQAFSMMNSLVFETLTVSSADDPSTAYGLIAESIEVPSDRSWVAFTVRPQARWHDGVPITADDVLWSFETLRAKGQPLYRLSYADVAKAEKTDERRVRFIFRPGTINNGLPNIIGQLPILPRHYWATRTFDQTTLDVPLGSGPYRIDTFEAGRHIVLRRDPAYWGRDLPVNKGSYNFDTIHVEYYRDYIVALEAFRAGAYDYRFENSSKAWATGYTFPAVTSGQVILEEIPHQRPQGMQAFVFNTRRALFQDPRVRQALTNALDFEWANKNLLYGQYSRSESYFANSELAATGLPDARELKILDPLRGRIPEEVFTTPYTAPRTDGSGTLRDNLRLADRLLEESGWTVKNQARVQAQTGEPFAFELLITESMWERVAAPFVQNLKRLGIAVTVRLVDNTVYENRIRTFDFDMVVHRWPQALSPGNEQRNFWGSQGADMEGGDNLIGIKSVVIDDLMEQLIGAPDRDSLVVQCRALDRVLLWNHYVIPHWHIGYDRVAYWNKLRRPARTPALGSVLWTWWHVDPGKS